MSFVIGDDDTLITLTRSQASEGLARLAHACKRRLWLRVPTLDALTADDQVVDAIKALAIASERSDVRVLFDDQQEAVRNGHRLIHLGADCPHAFNFARTSRTTATRRPATRLGIIPAFSKPSAARPRRIHLCGITACRERHALPGIFKRFGNGLHQPGTRELRL